MSRAFRRLELVFWEVMGLTLDRDLGGRWRCWVVMRVVLELAECGIG